MQKSGTKAEWYSSTLRQSCGHKMIDPFAELNSNKAGKFKPTVQVIESILNCWKKKILKSKIQIFQWDMETEYTVSPG